MMTAMSHRAGVDGGDVTGTEAGRGVVLADVYGTALFTASAVLAAVVFNGPTRAIGVVVAVSLFAIGVFSFLWSYWTAVQRSRTETIAVAQLYFLVSGVAPAKVRRVMYAALAVQVAVALATALARSSTDGRAGSTLAFGILVPMFGLGLNGLWCARHGRFAARSSPTDGEHKADSSVTPTDHEMEQNAPHG
jgi:hypothetical protein